MAFIKNLSGRYVFCNPAFGECLGLPPQKIIGRLDTDIWPEDVAAMLREYDAYGQREGKPLMVQEQVRLRSGGPTRHLQVSKFPLMQTHITGVAANAWT